MSIERGVVEIPTKFVRVSTELLAKMGTWSEPVQVMIADEKDGDYRYRSLRKDAERIREQLAAAKTQRIADAIDENERQIDESERNLRYGGIRLRRLVEPQRGACRA